MVRLKRIWYALCTLYVRFEIQQTLAITGLVRLYTYFLCSYIYNKYPPPKKRGGGRGIYIKKEIAIFKRTSVRTPAITGFIGFFKRTKYAPKAYKRTFSSVQAYQFLKTPHTEPI